MYHADDALVVANPEVSSVRDSDRVLGLLASRTRRAERGDEPIGEYLLLTRYSLARVEKGEMMAADDVCEILSIPLLGVIPESKSVLSASNAGTPVSLETGTDAGQAYNDAVARYLGEEREHRFLTRRRGFFGRIFGG